MNDPKEIRMNVSGIEVTILDYGDGVLVSKGVAGFDTPELKAHEIAAALAIEKLVAAHKRAPRTNANRSNAAVKTDQSKAWKQAVGIWVDKKLAQRKYRKQSTFTALAKQLLRPNSDFKWPEGVKPVSVDMVRKAISAHLKGKKNIVG